MGSHKLSCDEDMYAPAKLVRLEEDQIFSTQRTL
jgi:hypothetical protein|tara:strand:- start:645 stop:746 length:102 start_codon:yes stop_codon:yes gene_type:complete